MGLFRQMHHSAWNNEHGFGLIEISIALIIFSMLFGKGFSLWQIHNRTRKHELTLHHQRLIFKALAHYLQQNGCLPHPCATESLGNSGDDLGKSSTHNPRNGPVHPGIVPYRTLFLPERVAKDGFGHFMTYAVDVHMTRKDPQVKSKMCETFFSEQSALDIVENGQYAKQDLESNPQKWRSAKGVNGKSVGRNRYEGLAVILVSHGRHGWGAPQSNGQRIPVPSSAPKELGNNSGKGTTFWSPESDAIEYGVVQGKTRTSILDDAYFGCTDYFYPECSKSQNVQVLGAHFVQSKS
ncbi:MAG: prepilin-type N-terminal cleavage/methylation domain-containing protein [Alphaproteobacteria bacterium]|nr:prepilin-type N-terminal cleavage/methylation domain-containing protein [Alphaproteobacteria bacterium]